MVLDNHDDDAPIAINFDNVTTIEQRANYVVVSFNDDNGTVHVNQPMVEILNYLRGPTDADDDPAYADERPPGSDSPWVTSELKVEDESCI